MASSCQNLVAALKDCLKYSDCVMKQGHLPSECLKEHFADLPEECQSLRKATFECKRGMLDMRKRFRGNIVGSQFEFTPKDNIPTATRSSEAFSESK
ncbi:cytochrome c oxidase assembly protein PET191-domain-containing protein [Crucibulum laeve]|uniref:Cytochrome c oxidase assembly protein PET191-domain-containing protein n=1 Tax=Crucibulum laeve TaxID=68775 RepID=A0A5C3MDU0_9AGAR|nr:cytochrome c oxidase assembly protein PET191-domain-containing protein [Crucibulum laeve]